MDEHAPHDPCKLIVLALVELLKTQAADHAGTCEGLNPYQALLEIKLQAEIAQVPLSEIGLDSYDFDTALKLPGR